jgi:hypothetical protein
LVYYLNPYSSGYTADYIYETDEAIRSIDRFADLTRFLMGGNNGTGQAKYWMRNKLAGTSGDCIKYDQLYVKQVDMPDMTSHSTDYGNDNEPINSIDFIPVNVKIKTGCSN